jgi:hypothetical protein
MGLQALEVIGQLHDAAHQYAIGFVAIFDGAVEQGTREALHFLGHHRRAVEFHHAQRALHLVQVRGTETHLAGVGGFFDVGLERLASLLQGFVEFALDPGERGEVDFVLRPHAEPSLGLRTNAKV